MMKHFFILLFCSVFFNTNAFAQTVSNVVAEQQANDLLILYTLEAKESCEISLHLSTDAGRTWQGPVQSVTGDVGKNITAGKKQLRWTVLEDRESLEGNQIQFKIIATRGLRSYEPEMVFVQGGTFTMGCTTEQGNDCGNDERPAHKVILDDYYIGKYEVTQAQWKAVMGSNPSKFSGCDNCPVEQVSWDDVQEFIRKLNSLTGKKYGLPTEAQWEYAARGGNKSKSYKYSGSNEVDRVAWYWNNAEFKTHLVGKKLPNELGIYDMSGNIWEWCSDWYASYSSDSNFNHQSPSSDNYRILRGGSGLYTAPLCRVAYRIYNIPKYRNEDYGFRLVLSQ